MRNKVIVFTLLFIVFVVALAPARLVQNLMPKNTPIKLENMTGTVWSGNIGVATAKDWYVEDVDFQTSLIPLLMATASGNLSIGKGDLTGTLDFSVSDQNNLTLEQADLNMDAANLVNFVPFRGVELAGELLTKNFSATVEQQKIASLDGTIRWKNAVVSVNRQRWELGEFSIDWSTNDSDNVITGRLKKTKNLLDLEGNITLSSNGILEFKGSINSSTDRNIYTALSLFADGKAKLGRLPIKFRKKVQ